MGGQGVIDGSDGGIKNIKGAWFSWKRSVCLLLPLFDRRTVSKQPTPLRWLYGEATRATQRAALCAKSPAASTESRCNVRAHGGPTGQTPNFGRSHLPISRFFSRQLFTAASLSRLTASKARAGAALEGGDENRGTDGTPAKQSCCGFSLVASLVNKG